MGEFSKTFPQDQNGATATVPDSQPMIPRPCQGPSCGRDVPLPIPPTPIPTSSSPEKFAAWTTLLQADTSNLIQVLEQRDEFPSAGYPFGVKRPPRA
jgi:hypothetical protein